MASKSRFVRLSYPAADKVTGKNNVVGCVVIADYTSDGQRTIVVERPLTATGHRASKPKARKVDARPVASPLAGVVNG